MFDFIHFDGMKDTQNTSHAVMSQRFEPQSSLDDFPTPPWATRALIEKIIGVKGGHKLGHQGGVKVGHFGV